MSEKETLMVNALLTSKDEILNVIQKSEYASRLNNIREIYRHLEEAPQTKKSDVAFDELLPALEGIPNALEILFSSSYLVDPHDDLRRDVSAKLATLAEEAGLDIESTRFVLPKRDGSAVSIKLLNIHFDFGDLTNLVAGIINTSIKDVAGEANYFLKAAGVLLILSSIYKALEVEISEKEASVFWGFAQSCDEQKMAIESLIRSTTNVNRKKIGLKSLGGDEFKNSLYKLEKLKAIKRVGESPPKWIIVERYRLPSDMVDKDK